MNEQSTPCIEWTKARDKAGYGVSWMGGKFIRAHRKAYLLHKGDIPKGQVVRHTCDNRGCVNPTHLLLGTNADNSKDMLDRHRQAKGSNVGTSKLTEELVTMIRSMSGSSSLLSEFFNCSRTTIKDIKNNKLWRHV